MGALPPRPVALQRVNYVPKFEYDAIRAVVLIEQAYYIPTRFDIEFNAHGATDTAEFSLPISTNPDFSVMFQRNSSNQNVPVYTTIYAGFPTNPTPFSKSTTGLSVRFTGIVDSYSADFLRDTVTFKCRNMAAPLVDFPVTQLFMQQTSQDLVKTFAAQIGVQHVFNIGTPPVTLQEVFASEFVGGINFAATVTKVRAWDLLLKCALFDDADVWMGINHVTGAVTLNYQSPGLVSRKNVDIYYGRDVTDLTVEHSIQYAKNIRVEVHSYQKRIKQSHSVRFDTDLGGGVDDTSSSKTTVSSPIFGTSGLVTTTISDTGETTVSNSTVSGGHTGASTAPGRESALERYVFYLPNQSFEQCKAFAQATLRQLSMMEYREELSFPMTRKMLKDFDITMLLNINGAPYKNANSNFRSFTVKVTFNGIPQPAKTTKSDTRYWPRRITETLEPQSGWKLRVEAVNHSLPQGQV